MDRKYFSKRYGITFNTCKKSRLLQFWWVSRFHWDDNDILIINSTGTRRFSTGCCYLTQSMSSSGRPNGSSTSSSISWSDIPPSSIPSLCCYVRQNLAQRFSQVSWLHFVGHHLFTMPAPVCQGVFRAIACESMKNAALVHHWLLEYHGVSYCRYRNFGRWMWVDGYLLVIIFGS